MEKHISTINMSDYPRDSQTTSLINEINIKYHTNGKQQNLYEISQKMHVQIMSLPYF